MTILDSLLFVSALVGGLCLTFLLIGLVTDHLWPRLAMRHRLAATRAPRVRIARTLLNRRVRA